MTTRPSPVQPNSTTKKSGPRIEAHPTALISASASIIGHHPITIGPNAIIQIRSVISSAVGSIDIGEGCIISERAVIGHLRPEESQLEASDKVSASTQLGQGVVIESGTIIQARSIGAFTTVEVGASIGKGAVIGRDCRICSKVEVGDEEVLEDGVVVLGSLWGERRVEMGDGMLKEKRRLLVVEQGGVLRKAWTGK